MKCSTSLSVQYDNIFSPFLGSKWVEGLAWVKESGFDAVEIILSDPELLNLSAIQKELGRLDLPVSTISTGQAAGLEGLSMVSASRETRQAALKRLRADIDFAVELGHPHVTIGLIRGRGGSLPLEAEHALLLDSMKEIAEYAEAKNIILNLEPINRYECVHLNASLSGLELIRELGNPKNVGILYDTFHSNIEDVDMAETIRQLKGHISNVHIADSNRQLPGEGHIDFHKIRQALEESGYEGYVALEVLNRPSQQHIVECAGKSIRQFF